MVEGTRVRDLLPRAPAKLSKQIEIGDIILKVDNREATPKEVLTMLRGVDQGIVPSSCSRAPTTHCSAMDSRICDFTYCHSTLTQRVCVCVCVCVVTATELEQCAPVGSQCHLTLQKANGQQAVVVLNRMSTLEVYDIKVPHTLSLTHFFCSCCTCRPFTLLP